MTNLKNSQELYDIAKEQHGGSYTQEEKFGHNPSVPTSFEDVWTNSTNYTFPTTARTLTIQSSGNDNGASSSGARTVIIDGLDANWNEISEEIATNAAVDPTTTNSFIRVNRMRVGDAGTNGINENVITATSTTDLYVLAHIAADEGQSEQCIYSVPANYKIEIEDFVASVGKGEDFEVELETREFGKSWTVKQRMYLYQNTVVEPIDVKLSAKGDVKVRAKSLTNAGKPISCSFDYVRLATN